MTTSITHPSLTPEGILFTVVVDSVSRKCMVTRGALEALCQLDSIDEVEGGPLRIFQAYEARINGVARRLVGARVSGNPLVVSRATFNAPQTS